jgi:hypothetical protein
MVEQVAALFVRSDSVYKTLGLDCYDFERDAMTWPGGAPGVYHPPCRAWGKYKHKAKPRQGEKDLARWSMAKVRQFGGVIEHPASSDLWREFSLPGYGIRDTFGGVLFPVYQSWFGHRAPKETALYLVGAEIPNFENFYSDELASGRIEFMCKAEREKTPPAFALFLSNLASSCVVNHG